MQQKFNALKRSLTGYETKMRRLDPPPVNRRPYYPLVIGQTYVSDGSALEVQVKDVVKALSTQLGLSAQTATALTVKMQRVDCYAVSKADSSVRPSISVDYSSLVPCLGDPTTPGVAEVSYPHIKRLNDVGSVAAAATTSYTWPQAMRDIPLTQQSNFTLFEFSTNLTEVDVRIHVLWSTSDVASPV